MSKTHLALLPDMRDECGCSLLEGRCSRHAAMMAEIHEATFNGGDTALAVIWSLQDGYGEPGFTPCQGFDWSGIRDSSTDAIEAMHAAIHA